MELLQEIPFAELPFHSALVKAYLRGDENTKQFYSYAPSLDGLVQASHQKRLSFEQRNILVDAINRQYAILLAHEDEVFIKETIEKIRLPNTFTITTGHQLCVYTGPAYFIYKIASVISLAKQLAETAKDKNFIPVFWMASEDHDFEEISKVSFYGKSWTWEKENENFGKVSVGTINPNSLALWADEMKNYFHGDEALGKLLEQMKLSYQNKATLSTATREIVHYLFKSFGVVVIDGDDIELKNLFKNAMIRDMSKPDTAEAVGASSEKIKALGYETQITARDVNLFYINDDGHRERIDKTTDGTFVLNGSQKHFTLSELTGQIEKEAFRFSPNVVLRPVYQETILPNIAYIGGPAEVAYWLQLKGVFDYYNIQFPVILARSSQLVIPQHIIEIAAKYKFTWADYLNKNIEQLMDQFIATLPGSDNEFTEEMALFQKIADLLNNKASGIDRQLQVQVEIEQKNWAEGLKKLRSKFNKALKLRSDADLKQIQKIRNSIFPGGVFQERTINYLELSKLGSFNISNTVYLANSLDNTLKVVKE